MTLQSLAGRTLDRITPDKAQLLRLLAAADRNIVDAHNMPILPRVKAIKLRYALWSAYTHREAITRSMLKRYAALASATYTKPSCN